jgi:hypothetical protein
MVAAKVAAAMGEVGKEEAMEVGTAAAEMVGAEQAAARAGAETAVVERVAARVAVVKAEETAAIL